ncbi:MAG: hypothetical protein A3K14_03885 [Sulfurimonas sp. RIFCSPLOWO2_12_FULL_36_74]|nr:MAG: hypothetical protein A3J26_02805 [Sulfurimonas sp. RIFCSPLOWO2_02_FULL_36_28]OHE06915.1 MAG: hypothetical protein A3K14_03885 [Sulfurimonas sp. RIFCSPLOWO2_12_FULL_36_74]
MTTSLIVLFIFAFIMSAVMAGKNKTKYKQYKKYKSEEYEINTINSDKGNLYNTINIEKTRKEIFEENRRKRAREHNINIEKKGKDYEVFVANHFEALGYKVKNHGLIHGKKDEGIDVIIMKDKEITFIQCKNWKENSKYEITHKDIKEFIGNTATFIEKEENRDKADGYTIKRLYVTSNDVLDNSARHFLRENNSVGHIVIPM